MNPDPLPEQLEVCPAPAELIVFRGRTRRLYLCGGHRARYTGRGKVADYRIGDLLEGDQPGQVFAGPHRNCGEATD